MLWELKKGVCARGSQYGKEGLGNALLGCAEKQPIKPQSLAKSLETSEVS